MYSEKNYIITSVKINLNKDSKENIKSRMEDIISRRKSKQPLEYPNAGSTFKRGDGFITAQLIDECGLKGYLVGGAQVSEKHAGFIINKENATSKDILDLIQIVKQKVYEKFGKQIELEIIIIGE